MQARDLTTGTVLASGARVSKVSVTDCAVYVWAYTDAGELRQHRYRHTSRVPTAADPLPPTPRERGHPWARWRSGQGPYE